METPDHRGIDARTRAPMNVCWLTRFPLTRHGNSLYSAYAAVRLRTLLPAQALRTRGHVVSVIPIESGCANRDVAIPEDCQVAVFDQIYPGAGMSFDEVSEATLGLIAHLRGMGVRTAVDIHDDHFHLAGRSAYFKRAAQLADVVVANTSGMKQTVAKHTDGPVEVIGDPFEGPYGEPLFMPRARSAIGRTLLSRLPWRHAPDVKLLWFGHQSNLAALYDLMPQLLPLAKRFPMQMTVMSGAGSGAEEACEIFNHHHGRRCPMIFAPWSLENTWTMLRACDLCVIPVDMANRSKSVKSANRLIETLRAGRFPVASPLPAYQEFASSAWLGETIPHGIQWALDHRAQVVERIHAGQRAIEQAYSPNVIGGQWERVMLGLIG